MLTAIRARANGDGWTHDRLESLARYSCMTVPRARRSLAWLRAHQIVRDERRPMKGGIRGQVWSWRRRALDLTEWPERMRVSMVGASSADEPGATERLIEGRGVQNERMRRSKRPDEALKRRGIHPDTYPDTFPEDRSRDEVRGPRAVSELVGRCRCSHWSMEHRRQGSGSCQTCEQLHRRCEAFRAGGGERVIAAPHPPALNLRRSGGRDTRGPLREKEWHLTDFSGDRSALMPSRSS